MREQRTIFGEVAELYDKARAAYPEALFDDVLDYARCTATSSMRALEIGAGTGKATVVLLPAAWTSSPSSPTPPWPQCCAGV